MKLHEITAPIRPELELVQEELRSILPELTGMAARTVFEHYFQIPGKLLRPSLLLLSAGAADPARFASARDKLVKAATAMELLHNASLIHDDIVDGEELRRGQRTLNQVYGEKIAVMAGNALFARAVSAMLKEFPRESALKMLRMIRRMSTAEIRHLDRISNGAMDQGGVAGPEGAAGSSDAQEYLSLITDKTALLMSNSCAFGVSAISQDRELVSRFENFGLNFGITYQIMDDCIDKDETAIRFVSFRDAETYAGKALSCLEGSDSSEYRTALEQMLRYVLSQSHVQAETSMKTQG